MKKDMISVLEDCYQEMSSNGYSQEKAAENKSKLEPINIFKRIKDQVDTD